MTNHYGFYTTQAAAGDSNVEENVELEESVEKKPINGEFLSPLGDLKVTEENSRKRRSFLGRQRSSSNKTRFYESCDKKRPKAGLVSDDLRLALGLKSDELPPWIYRMRVFGYPPGYIEEAKQYSNELIMHNEPSSPIVQPTVAYDYNEFVQYPGFNSPLPYKTKDEFRRYDSPQYNSKFSLKNTFPQDIYPAAKKPVLTPRRIRKTSLEDLEARKRQLEKELNEYESDPEEGEEKDRKEKKEKEEKRENQEDRTVVLEHQKALNIESKSYSISALKINKPGISAFAKDITPYEQTFEVEPVRERNIMKVITEINKDYEEKYRDEMNDMEMSDESD